MAFDESVEDFGRNGAATMDFCQIRLVKERPDQKIGMHIENIEGVLNVTGIFADGVVEKHGNNNPGQGLCVGDKIIGVNHAGNIANEILKEMKTKEDLWVAVIRG